MVLWHILTFCQLFLQLFLETIAALSPLEALNHEVHRLAGAQVLFSPHCLATLVERFQNLSPVYTQKTRKHKKPTAV